MEWMYVCRFTEESKATMALIEAPGTTFYGGLQRDGHLKAATDPRHPNIMLEGLCSVPRELSLSNHCQ